MLVNKKHGEKRGESLLIFGFVGTADNRLTIPILNQFFGLRSNAEKTEDKMRIKKQGK